jgi:hypothetical protein
VVWKKKKCWMHINVVYVARDVHVVGLLHNHVDLSCLEPTKKRLEEDAFIIPITIGAPLWHSSFFSSIFPNKNYLKWRNDVQLILLQIYIYIYCNDILLFKQTRHCYDILYQFTICLKNYIHLFKNKIKLHTVPDKII